MNSFDKQLFYEYEGCEAKNEYLIPSWEQMEISAKHRSLSIVT